MDGLLKVVIGFDVARVIARRFVLESIQRHANARFSNVRGELCSKNVHDSHASCQVRIS